MTIVSDRMMVGLKQWWTAADATGVWESERSVRRKSFLLSASTGECGKRKPKQKPRPIQSPFPQVAEESNLHDTGCPEIAGPAAPLRSRIHALGGGKVSPGQVQKVHESALCGSG